MELNDFLMHVAMRKPLDTPEIMELLNRMSDEARRITFELNGSYHTMEEIRALMSRLFWSASRRHFPGISSFLY